MERCVERVAVLVAFGEIPEDTLSTKLLRSKVTPPSPQLRRFAYSFKSLQTGVNAISERIARNTLNGIEREYLYRIIPLFPAPALVNVLSNMGSQFPDAEGEAGSAIHDCLHAAIDACRQCTD
jgi:hypothetical protein